MSHRRSGPPAFRAVAAGEEGDNRVEDSDDAVDDGVQHGSDGVDDAHQAGADGTEGALDLVIKSVLIWMMVKR